MEKSSKSHENCCVYGCHSIRKRDRHLTFHRFPSKGRKVSVENQIGQFEQEDQVLVWERALRLGNKSSKHMKVCSLHFQEDDFEKSGWSSRRTLKPNVIPSRNIPRHIHGNNRQRNDNKIAVRKQRNASCQHRKEIKQERIPFTHTLPDTNTTSSVQNVAVDLSMLQSAKQPTGEPLFKDVAIQVNTRVNIKKLELSRDQSTQTDCKNRQHT